MQQLQDREEAVPAVRGVERNGVALQQIDEHRVTSVLDGNDRSVLLGSVGISPWAWVRV
jgi:hypothetical protein